jgi:hypothetical protein
MADADSSSGEDDVSKQVLESLIDKLDKSAAKDNKAPKEKENKSMAFLRKIGKVGGASNKNFVNAVGSDEGSTGRQPPEQRKLQKQKKTFTECVISGVIDDLSGDFPLTSSGTQWRGVSDRVMGGVSNGMIVREEDLEGRAAIVLKGHVSLDNGGGFIQMVTDLALDPSNLNAVDARDYDGIELDVLCQHEPLTFNVHLRTPGTFQQASYRHTVELDSKNEWDLIRIPFSSFQGYGASEMPPLDVSELRRIGIVAIGAEMDVFLAVAGARFYSVF